MEDIEYDKKFDEMQKYVPFLDRVIEKLKHSDQDKPRKTQLEKMQTLHTLLNNREKKLKIETLLKCESVLKKLHAKIEKSDDTATNSGAAPTTPIHAAPESLVAARKVPNSTHAAQQQAVTVAAQQKHKIMPNRNLIEIRTCPASPPHLRDEDFRPPVEIPTERRSSPIRFLSPSRWDPNSCKEPPIEKPVQSVRNRPSHKPSNTNRPSRWSSETIDLTRSMTPTAPSSSASHQRSWSSSATSTSTSSSSKNHRSHTPQTPKYTSEEENWDSPEEETLPKFKQNPKSTSHKDSSSKHHSYHNHRNYDKNHPPLPPPQPEAPPPLPPSVDSDVFHDKLYHETIYKYKTQESSASFNKFINPPPPEARTPSKHSSNKQIFDRLGDKVDTFENFRIHVKNDTAIQKLAKSALKHPPPPPPPLPLLVSAKPIVDVLKSPPLSADDIDDLLNESLEAAMEEKRKKNAVDSLNSMKDSKPSSLDTVRKKLAMISKPSSPGPEATQPAPSQRIPITSDNKPDNPFSRRGKSIITQKPVEVGLNSPLHISSPLASPLSPPQQSITSSPMDAVVERLALKYKPHKRRPSVAVDGVYSPQGDRSVPSLNSPFDQKTKPIVQRRASMVSPIHAAAAPAVDPRLSKNVGHISKPVPNVLPTINNFDPRLRKNNLNSNTGKPPLSYHKPTIPSLLDIPPPPFPRLLDIQINIPLAPNCISPQLQQPPFNIPPPSNCISPQLQQPPLIKAFNNPISKPSPPVQNYNAPIPNRAPDPRLQKTMKMYPDKFNAQRNDQTERMKYLESKRNKPPEPKTYGEYRQSKCREQQKAAAGTSLCATEELSKTTTESTTPVVPSIQSLTPSTLDKMYRTADYGHEMGGSIHGFKIPKKPKPPEEQSKPIEPEPAKSIDVVEPRKHEPEPAKSIDVVEPRKHEDIKKNQNETQDPSKPPTEKPKETETQDPSQSPTEKPKETEENLPDKPAVLKSQSGTIVEKQKENKKKSSQEAANSNDSTQVTKSKKGNKSTNKNHAAEIEECPESKTSEVVSKFDLLLAQSTPEISNTTVSESLDESANESRLVIDEDVIIIESQSPEPPTIVDLEEIEEKTPESARFVRSRRPRKKKNMQKVEFVVENKSPEEELPPGEPMSTLQEPESAKLEEKPASILEPESAKFQEKPASIVEEKFKTRRITTRRSTIIMKEAAEAAAGSVKQKCDSPAPIGSPRRRSASDIFSPSNDNSIVSTMNIIEGKRRTRASINFNEKNTKKPATPKSVPVAATAAASTPSPAPPAKSNQSTPRLRGKSTDSKQSKKTTTPSLKKVEAIEAKPKTNSEDGQICAVSSTTTESEKPHTEPLSVSVGSSLSPTEEPSSSNSGIVSDPGTPLTDDNKKKFIEGFLLTIADPSTNKDRILDMLKTVLDDKKLQQVKEILYSPEKVDHTNVESDKSNEEQNAELNEANKPRVTRTKKNELDRLNEDIRDMFICQGVVTATGRRMCTLAKDAASPSLVSPLSTSSSSRKTPVPQTKGKKKTPSPAAATTKPSQPTAPAPKRRMRKAKVLLSPLNMRALRSRNQKAQTTPPKMPVLAPNTPIKLPRKRSKERSRESSKDDIPIAPKTVKAETKATNNKPKPMSRRQSPVSVDGSDSSDDDIELASLRSKLKRKEEVIEPKNAKKGKKEADTENTDKKVQKSKQPKKNNKKEEEEEELKLVVPKKEKEIKAALPAPAPTIVQVDEEPFKRNTNPEHHTKSDYAMCCVICKERARFIAPHYITIHKDSEIYTSRMPPNVLDDIKQGIGNRAIYFLIKKPLTCYHYNCPFCDFSSTQPLRGWMEHFTIHTGEYMYKCSNCFKAMNSSTYMTDHIKKVCTTAKRIIRDPINLHRVQGIPGYVCHLCNFVQMLRSGIVKHLKIHHELEDEVSKNSIIEIKLIDTVDVPKMEEVKANETAVVTDTSTVIDSSILNISENVASTSQKEVVSGVVVDSQPENKDQENSEEEKDPLKITEKDVSSDDKSMSETPSNLEPSISIVKDIEAFLSREHVEEETEAVINPTVDAAPTTEAIVTSLKPPLPTTVDIEVFLPRDLASPTSIDLAESLKSIDKENEENDSDTGNAQSTPKKMTIAERLSQRFRDIEKQASDVSQVEVEETTNATEIESPQIAPPPSDPQIVETEELQPSAIAPNDSLNESGNLIIDEEQRDDESVPPTNAKEVENDAGSESDDDANANDEDDNDNWEDIEITETRTSGNGTQKDKSKNKSIFQTLSRLYASIAPKKTISSKKTKEKEPSKKKSESLERVQRPTNASMVPKIPDKTIPTPEVSSDPLLTGSKQLQPPQQTLPSLSEFILDSQSDSLDMLLNTNFNCLEGDGTNFPHLDLNDLDSTIFTLPEEQENIQDAISMVTDLDHSRYDILGNPLPLSKPSQASKPPQSQTLQPWTVQKIGNFGFSLNGSALKYYCLVNSCAFMFSDDPDGLQSHFMLEHPNLKWNGYCQTCRTHVGDMSEMKHILEVHSKVQTEEASGASEGEKPRIKFRRLTGDILSTDKPQQIDLLMNDMFSPSSTPSTECSLNAQSPAVQTLNAPNSDSNFCNEPPSLTNPPPHEAATNYPELTFKTMLESAPKPIQCKNTSELSLSSMLQSEPKAMIPHKAPPKTDMDIPLFKNVSKDFTITSVAEGVPDNDLFNFVLKHADTGPGGIQISQVISLNAGGKSVSPLPQAQLSDRVTSAERRNSPSSVGNFRNVFSSARTSPASINHPNVQQRKTPTPPTQQIKQSIPGNTADFVCRVALCPFSTNLRSAMNDHILSHIRHDNNRDSLRCHLCSFVGKETTGYFRHMAQIHSKPDSCLSTVDLTQKIQDILRKSATKQDHESQEQEQDLEEEPQILLQNQQSVEKPREELSFSERLRNTATEIVANTGLAEEEIWRCIFYPECECSVTEKDFQTHLATHTNIVPTSFPSLPPGSSLNCPHCTVNYYRAAVLKAHMKTHTRHQFFCFVCSLTTFANFQQVQKHFNDVHSRSGNIRPQNLIPGDKTDKPSFFVANDSELSAMELIQFGEKLIVDWERKKALNKTHFKPNEQYLLPIQPIFNQQVYCSVCNYKTKVRTNMFRHLQLHNQDVDVGSVDPVNPVPCLEKNEKHFDKMLNLACSSNAGTINKPKETVKIPAFVPDMKRYVCGHPGCKYLTLNDQMLRSHLNALHGSEKGYLCPHCQEELCKKNMCAERIVQHLKFHGNKIYQCGECEYFHYTRHVVERHVNEKHSGVSAVSLFTFDRNESDTRKTSIQLFPGKSGAATIHSASGDSGAPVDKQAAANTASNIKMKWECALCKHQTVTWNQMISHANSMHSAKHQYHCVHCTFGSSQLVHIMDHIDHKHPSKIREAKYVFYKINESLQDKAADTRPLWSRNDPKRVRSIRGILMENEEDAERTKKNLSRAGVDLDEDLDEYEPASDDFENSPRIPGGLSCFHCSFTSVDINSMCNHWKTKHWYEKNAEMVPRVPFFFRVHTILKCPLCPHVGDHISLKIHLVSQHLQRNFCAADPILSNTCGHCPFVYPPSRLEILTNHYLREHKPTDVKNLSSGLLKHLLTLGECQVYMQCYFCAEICADKTAIIEHERERHKNSNFRYKQIKDEVIYRCGMCQYSSTNELATLRHMIDHFSGFNFCHFCKSVQSSFNSYMQHCYSNHVKALANFKEIYKFDRIATFLGEMLLIFPNGLIINKKNLQHTQYGNTDRIQAIYEEISKKALEPPIPPLCVGRLLAQKSLEAGQPLLPPPPNPVTARRIAKRRSTVAMGGCEQELSGFLVPSLRPEKIKKRKSSICGDFQQPIAPLFSTITSNTISSGSSSVATRPSLTLTDSCDANPVIPKKLELQGFSFYGKKPDPIDLSKIFTHIAIGDKYAPVSVKKFSLLFKINTKVVVEPMDHGKYQDRKRSSSFTKPCPASKKKKT